MPRGCGASGGEVIMVFPQTGLRKCGVNLLRKGSADCDADFASSAGSFFSDVISRVIFEDVNRVMKHQLIAAFADG